VSASLILGAGVTGLAAGLASGLPVFEAMPEPGGICASYYVRPGDSTRLYRPPADGEAYRFELGGGHWIFGGDAGVLRFIERATHLRRYARVSAVFLPDRHVYIPYPIQDHLSRLDPETRARALREIGQSHGPFRTMKEWLQGHFGDTLCRLFFEPFHDLYTAGLHEAIAPQDPYKSPLNLAQVARGAVEDPPPVGYNVTYGYPVDGLDALARWMAARCDVRYGKRAVGIDPARREVAFADGTRERYETLISTLPLNRLAELCSLDIGTPPDPFTSVLVLNIGATRGDACPPHHWIYVPRSASRFHRVGFYSNVDPAFLPRSVRARGTHVAIYVERAYRGGMRPSDDETRCFVQAVLSELRAWGYIDAVEVADATWIDVAYTWSWPASDWARRARRALEERGIYPIGRYGRWIFQGIADSLRDGFYFGAAFRSYEGVRP
jgi:protoporphyrinogen oxidase